MKKSILLSLILISCMSSLLDAGVVSSKQPPSAPDMPGPGWKQKAASTPASSGKTPAKPKGTPKPSGASSSIEGGFHLVPAKQKTLPIGTEITVDQGLVLKVFDKNKMNLSEDQEAILKERLKNVQKISVPGKKEVVWKGKEVDFAVALVPALKREDIGLGSQVYYESVILTKDGKPAEAAPARPKPSGPKLSGPKPSVPLSQEQKLAQNLASLEVNLTTLSKKI